MSVIVPAGSVFADTSTRGKKSVSVVRMVGRWSRQCRWRTLLDRVSQSAWWLSDTRVVVLLCKPAAMSVPRVRALPMGTVVVSRDVGHGRWRIRAGSGVAVAAFASFT